MTPARSPRHQGPHPDASADPGRRLRSAALAVMLACLAARGLLSELPYDISAVQVAGGPGHEAVLHAKSPNPSQLLRVVLACALLSSAGLWALGEARTGSVAIRHPWLGVLIAAFALWSLFSTLGAADRRAAWTAWIEQVSLLAACFTAAQMCRRRRSRDLLLSAAAALCLVLVARSAWQLAFEFPASRSQWRHNKDTMLREAGYDPDSPDAAMLEKRVLADTPYGFMTLSNPFGSMMIVLGFAAAGLAVERLSAARASRPPPEAVRPGEIHLPALAGGLIAAVAAAAAVVVLLTRSRGAIAAMILAAAAAAGVYRFRRVLGRHWPGALLVTVAVVVLAAGATAGHGLARGRLPTRTMTFRWYYWTGAARIVNDRPLFGTGGGNFPNAYLRHRPIEAEEAVKTPHNVVVHALVQYGVPGGVCLVAAIAYVLAASVRPGQKPVDPRIGNARPSQGTAVTFSGRACSPRSCSNDTRRANSPAKRTAVNERSAAPMFAGAVAVALIGRWLSYSPAGGTSIFVFNVLMPAGLLAGALAFARWQVGRAPQDGPISPAARILLVCGLGGFVLHNAVTFSMWVPGAATVFWVLGGLCLAQTPGARALRLVRWRWPAAAVVAAGAVTALLLCPPVIEAYRRTAECSGRIRAGALVAAAGSAEAAALADPSSTQAAIDAATVAGHAAVYVTSSRNDAALAADLAGKSLHWADRAVARDPANPQAHKIAAQVRFRSGRTGQQWREALEHFDRAVALDPMNMRLRLVYASCLLEAGRDDACLAQLHEIKRIDGTLEQDSVMRLTNGEIRRLSELKRLAENGAE